MFLAKALNHLRTYVYIKRAIIWRCTLRRREVVYKAFRSHSNVNNPPYSRDDNSPIRRVASFSVGLLSSLTTRLTYLVQTGGQAGLLGGDEHQRVVQTSQHLLRQSLERPWPVTHLV